MTEPTDRAVLLLQPGSELLLESRAIAQQLEVTPDGEEPPAQAAERIAYGILVAALEEGLVSTVQHALDILSGKSPRQRGAERGVAHRAGETIW